jgi:hypothetical protein
MDTINATPTNVGADISRIRQWLLQGQGNVYRQNIVFSELNFVELHALFAKYDKNFAGQVMLTRFPKALLSEVS